MVGLSILIASAGRASLQTVVREVVSQMAPGDELLLDVNTDAPFGNAARNRLMPRARSGNGLVFLDDDDLLLPGGLEAHREAYLHAPDRLHIFKMRFRNFVIWSDPEVRQSNVSTQMICVPQSWTIFSQWGNRYEGDFDFIQGLVQHFGESSIVWHEDLVASHNGLRMPSQKLPQPF